MIDQMLEFSQPARQEMYFGTVDISALASEIAQELKEIDPNRVIQFEIRKGLTVYGDKNLLKMALKNLLENAWKFTSNEKKGKVEVGLKRDKKEAKPVLFVKDNGAGFDPNYAKNLFIPFRRLHSSKEFEGSGIGLATVQRIIHRHGGRIWAESEIGKGAVFYFSI